MSKEREGFRSALHHMDEDMSDLADAMTETVSSQQTNLGSKPEVASTLKNIEILLKDRNILKFSFQVVWEPIEGQDTLEIRITATKNKIEK